MVQGQDFGVGQAGEGRATLASSSSLTPQTFSHGLSDPSYHGFTTTSPIIMIARSQSRSARTYSALDRWLLSSLNILEPLGLRPLPLVFALRHHTSYYYKYFTSATTSVALDVGRRWMPDGVFRGYILLSPLWRGKMPRPDKCPVLSRLVCNQP